MRKLTLIAIVIVLCAGGAARSARAKPALSVPSNISDSEKDLSKVAERWAKRWSEKKLDQLIELYAPNAVFLTGQGTRITGREAIRALFKTAMESNNPRLTVRSVVTEQSGNLAYDSGEYSETITPVSGGPTRNGKGNYVIVFKRQTNGKWLIIEHIWTDAPAG